MIRTHALRKTFGTHVVLDGIDLDVPAGTVYALLGPNGAGKTTTVSILSTLLTPDSGHVWVAGHELSAAPAAVRAAIGVTGQFSAVDGLLTGAENLRLMADLAHLGRRESARRTTELLERFRLTAAAGKRAADYSGGMRRRLDLAMSLVGRPQVVFLDEPTTGLDPRSRRDMWQIVRELAGAGVTILLTTQYLEEADELADRIGVLDNGRLVAEGTAAELKRRVPGGHVELQFGDAADLDAVSAALTDGVRDDEHHTLRIPSDGSVAALRALLAAVDHVDSELAIDKLTIVHPTLDDVFFALTTGKVIA